MNQEELSVDELIADISTLLQEDESPTPPEEETPAETAELPETAVPSSPETEKKTSVARKILKGV